METLNQNWLTEGMMDFEYKKYLLLAYLQQVSKNFDEKKLYPRLSELVDHYQNIRILRDQKLSVAKEFPKEISRLDFEKFKVEYKESMKDSDLIKEIDSIVEFALPEIEGKIGIGKELYEEVQEQLEVFPVGIIPIRNDEGYFFLSDYLKKMVNVYYYQISIFENVQEKFRGIHTSFLFHYQTSITDTYEKVKYQLLGQHTHLPNPATYAIEFKQSFPLSETMLPIAQRSLVKYISTGEGK
ncbi:MAG: hypothetical protein IPP77_06145 [Bacteroidetes bacterium]|nr:hypothetical protein [Bacteroidota bacterium]